MASEAIQQIIRGKLDAYEGEFEVWKEDHESAMLYFDFRDLLADGVNLFHSVTRLDENWRREVFKRPDLYDESYAPDVLGLYRRWDRIARQVEASLLPWFQQEYGRVDHADEFLACAREVKGILTPDDEFFAGDALSKLEAAALDEHRKGLTVEHRGPQ
ncbi:MAG TPA: hypothetical protein VMV69_24815 [Pirellulales bacterium]|nr:hypothetical protein [Pirellulales bacterium]